MRCPACGHENPQGSRFCGGCGAAQSHSQPEQAPHGRRSGWGRLLALLVLLGIVTIAVAVGAFVLLGRSADSGETLSKLTVSDGKDAGPPGSGFTGITNPTASPSTAAPASQAKPTGTTVPTPATGTMPARAQRFELPNPNQGGKFQVSGTNSTLDKVRIEVPRLSIITTEDKPLTLSAWASALPKPANQLPVGRIDERLTAVGPTMAISPSQKLKFSKSITITLPYSPTLLPKAFNPAKLSVAMYSPDSGWEMLRRTVVNTTTNEIQFWAPHLTDFTPMAGEGGEDLAKGAIFDAAGDIGLGVDIVDSVILAPLAAYIQAPDEEKGKVVFETIFVSLVGKLPGVGVTIAGGKTILGTTHIVIEEMIKAGTQQQYEAAIFGASGQNPLGVVRNMCAKVDFFTLHGFKQDPRENVTPENIGKLTPEQFYQKWEAYIRTYREFGREQAETCEKALPVLQELWKAQRIYFKLQEFRWALKSRTDAVIRQLRERAAEESWRGAGIYVLQKKASGFWHYMDNDCQIVNYEFITVKTQAELTAKLGEAIVEFDNQSKLCKEKGCDRGATFARIWWPYSWSVRIYEGPLSSASQGTGPKDFTSCIGTQAGSGIVKTGP